MKIREIDFTIRRIIELLRTSEGEEQWVVAFEGLRESFRSAPEQATSKLLSMYGGMGSLNDLVLYQNGQAMVVENNEFDLLRAQLYELVRS